MTKNYTAEQRDRIIAVARSFLENRGVDVDQLERNAAQARAALREFSKPLGEGVTSRFQTIPEGNEEFRIVGKKSGGLAPRCQARSRRSGWKQCNAIAKAGHRVCIRHGASARGKKTAEGIQRSASHVLVHARETREARGNRSRASKQRRKLERLAYEQGIALTPAMRGPQPGTVWEHYVRNREKRLARITRRTRGQKTIDP